MSHHQAQPRAAPYLLVGAGLAACAALLSLRLVTSGDPFCHLAVGRWIAQHRAIPRTNLFMYTTPDFPWVDHSWLFEWLLYAVHQVAGVVGIQVMVLLCLWAVLAILLHLWRRMGVSAALAPLPFLLVMVLTAERFRPRPELATWLCMAVTISLLLRWREAALSDQEPPGRAIWALPLLAVPWANLHGGLASGLLLCLVFTGAEGARTLAARRFPLARALPPRRWLTLALVTAAMAAAALINPYGLDWYRSVGPGRIGFLRDFIWEWRPFLDPGGHVPASLPVLVTLLVLLIASFALSRRFDLTALALVVAFAALTVQSRRNLSLFGLVALAVMASNLSPPHRVGRPEGTGRWIQPALAMAGGLFGLAVIALALGIAPFSKMARMRRLGLGIDRKVLPVAAERFVRSERLPGPLFNEYRYGGYLVWASSAKRPLFIDGLNAYGETIFKDYQTIRRLRPGAQARLDRWGINTCLLPAPQVTPVRPDGDLRTFLDESPEWDLAYLDFVAAVFVRATPQGGRARPALP